jgi:hypothetical protein
MVSLDPGDEIDDAALAIVIGDVPRGAALLAGPAVVVFYNAVSLGMNPPSNVA